MGAWSQNGGTILPRLGKVNKRFWELERFEGWLGLCAWSFELRTLYLVLGTSSLVVGTWLTQSPAAPRPSGKH